MPYKLDNLHYLLITILHCFLNINRPDSFYRVVARGSPKDVRMAEKYSQKRIYGSTLQEKGRSSPSLEALKRRFSSSQ